MNEEEKKAVEMLDKFITEHKLFNIKQADNLEDNIQILLNLIKKQNKMIEIMAENLTTPTHNKEWVIKYFEGEVELEDGN